MIRGHRISVEALPEGTPDSFDDIHGLIQEISAEALWVCGCNAVRKTAAIGGFEDMISLRLPARSAEHAIGNRNKRHEGILRVVRLENGCETYRLHFIPHGRSRRLADAHYYVANGRDEMLDMLLGCVMPEVARKDTVSARDWIRRKLAETNSLEFSVQLDDLRLQRFRI